MNRRDFLLASGAALFFARDWVSGTTRRATVVKDYSGLDRIPVAGIKHPLTTAEVSESVASWPGKISIGGGRFSMGGQVATAESLHLDMRGMNQIVNFDPSKRSVRVQSGMSWRKLQDVIDPANLSVSIMQSYSNFSVGGSVAVNCHGRYVGKGPIANSIHAIQLVTSDGRVHELTPASELFKGVIGGYGGLGVITEVELALDENTRLRRVVEKVHLEDYLEYFRENIANNPNVLLHNADLRPPKFSEPRAISWEHTDEPLTIPDRLIPQERDYGLEQTLLWVVSEFPGAKHFRRNIEDSILEREAVVWRNYESSLDTDMLEPRTRMFSTYLLQEYFIPVQNFLSFTRSMKEILTSRHVNALNISIRHSPADSITMLPWARDEVFSFVLYYKQRTHRRARKTAESWTRELIDASLENGGRYYLPYRLHATRSQFQQAYPEISSFASLKGQMDPSGKFSNSLWDKYL